MLRVYQTKNNPPLPVFEINTTDFKMFQELFSCFGRVMLALSSKVFWKYRGRKILCVNFGCVHFSGTTPWN